MLNTRKYIARILNGQGISYNLKDLISYVNFIFSYKENIKIIETNVTDFNIQVLSLVNRKDRRSYIDSHLTSLNLNYTIVDSFDGETQSDFIYSKILLTKHARKYLHITSIAGIMTHMKAWEKILKLESEISIILEDDITLNVTKEQLKQNLKYLPENFDLVYLGSGSRKGRLFMKKVNNFLLKPFSVRKGAYAYLLTKSGAKKLLKSIDEIKITCGGIDTVLGILQMRKQISAYHLSKDIVEHLNLFESSIIK